MSINTKFDRIAACTARFFTSDRPWLQSIANFSTIIVAGLTVVVLLKAINFANDLPEELTQFVTQQRQLDRRIVALETENIELREREELLTRTVPTSEANLIAENIDPNLKCTTVSGRSGLIFAGSCNSVGASLHAQSTYSADLEVAVALKPQRIRIDTSDIQNFEAVRHITGLEYLQILNGEIESLTPLEQLRGLHGLTLSLSNDVDLAPIGNLLVLDVLDLQGVQIDNFGFLSNLTKLRRLFIRNATIGAEVDLTDLPSLEMISFLNVTFEDPRVLEKLNAPNELDLTGTLLGPEVELGAMGTNLQRLNISSTDLASLNQLDGLFGLKKLTLNGARELVTLDGISSLTSLQSLTAYQTIISVEEAAPLLSQLPELSELNHHFRGVRRPENQLLGPKIVNDFLEKYQPNSTD